MGGPSIMIDGEQFQSRTATGIGSYARTLAAALTGKGCAVAVLFGRRVRSRPDDPPLALAAQVFGNEPAGPGLLARIIFEAPAALALRAGWAGVRTLTRVDATGVELATLEPPLPRFTSLWNSNQVFERAHRSFALSRRLLEIEPPPGSSVAHWTAPIPLKARSIPNIYTLHDLIPLQFPHFVIDRGGRSAKLHAAIARVADHIITVSESSRRDIVQLLGVAQDRVSVTYQPVMPLPSVERADAERLVEKVYGAKPGHYALFLGAIEPKKNLRRLIEAFLLSGTEVPLLLAGPLGWLYDDDLELIKTVGLHALSRTKVLVAGEPSTDAPVRHLGYLPRRHIVALLKCARFFVFPSIYEGFGLPVVEALQLGVPVLTSNTSSLPEVAGDAAVLVDPLDIGAMSREIRRISGDEGLRAELSRLGPAQAAKFSEASYGPRLESAYAKVGIRLDQGSTPVPDLQGN